MKIFILLCCIPLSLFSASYKELKEHIDREIDKANIQIQKFNDGYHESKISYHLGQRDALEDIRYIIMESH